DQPLADQALAPLHAVSRLAREHVTVAVGGEGADELFGGYLTHCASLLARSVRRLPRWTLALARKAAARWPVSDEKIGFEYKLQRFLEGCAMHPARAHVYWNGTFTGSEKRSLLRSPLPGALAGTLKDLVAAGDHLAAYLWFDQAYFLPDDILTKVDRISMAHALEVRPPFLDHRIVEFAASLPNDLRIRGSRQKVILKDLMRDKLPAVVLTRKKTGLDIPAHQWLRGLLRPLFRDTLESASTRYSDFFRFAEIERYARAHESRRANLGYHLWGLLTLFLWMKRWSIETAPVTEPARTAEKVFGST
ncbi:MAG: asparagine synthetase B, partial [Acidobacteriia bacterium]|nr:asparagine synthetase B [Terriglobia bacterium]